MNVTEETVHDSSIKYYALECIVSFFFTFSKGQKKTLKGTTTKLLQWWMAWGNVQPYLFSVASIEIRTNRKKGHLNRNANFSKLKLYKIKCIIYRLLYKCSDFERVRSWFLCYIFEKISFKLLAQVYSHIVCNAKRYKNFKKKYTHTTH